MIGKMELVAILGVSQLTLMSFMVMMTAKHIPMATVEEIVKMLKSLFQPLIVTPNNKLGEDI
jgi:DNA-binding Xre family transcriptional regulator